MTPFEVGILMHYYCRRDDCEAYKDRVPIWEETKAAFMREGLLEVTPQPNAGYAVFSITLRGKAYVEALMRVPLPEQTWTVRWPVEELNA